MRDYAVVANIKAEQKGIIDDVFDKGYEQGYHDGKLDGEAEKIEKLEKQFDDEKKAEYKRGYEQGRMSTLTIKDFEKIRRSQYDRGYKDACNDKDLITCKKSDEISDKAYKDGYNKGIHEVLTIDIFEGIKLAEYNKGYGAGYKDAYEIGKKDGQKAERMLFHEPLKKDLEEAYQKGLKHGQELRAEEAKCAEACGMKRAWEVARKIVLSDAIGGIPSVDILKIYGTSYYGVMKNIPVQEAVAKLDEWEKKQGQEQEQSKKRCENCDHYCGYDNKFKCDIKGVLCIERDRWTPKQKQVEKSCKTCSHTETGMPKNDDAQCEECHFDGSGNTLWQPKEKQDAPEMNVESIEVGDEVYQLDKNYTYIVTNTDDKIACFFSRTGHWGCRSISELHKTGRHFPIQEILDAMKNNSEENNDNDG